MYWKDMKYRWNTASSGAYPFVKLFLKELRENETKEEKLLWEHLRNKKIGHKIRRQHVIDKYIADFVCIKKRLIIEIDGKVHMKKKKEDMFRTTILGLEGWKVIRFTNDDVKENPEKVVKAIKQELDNREDW
jgi:very-short-patch-repair endonuclease